MLVPPHFLVSTAFKKMRWKDEFRKWLPKLSNNVFLVLPCQETLIRPIIQDNIRADGKKKRNTTTTQ